MGDADLKARLIEESKASMHILRETQPMAVQVVDGFDRQYLLGDPVDYEPTPDRAIAVLAAARGVEPIDEFYDRLRERGGEAMLMMPFLGYAHGNGDALYEMLTHPAAVLGLADMRVEPGCFKRRRDTSPPWSAASSRVSTMSSRALGPVDSSVPERRCQAVRPRKCR